VDATRSSTKRFPDAFSKTVPIWTAVLNRAVRRHRQRTASAAVAADQEADAVAGAEAEASRMEVRAGTVAGDVVGDEAGATSSDPEGWDAGVRLPLWVGRSEKEEIDRRLDGFVAALERADTDLGRLAGALRHPLRAMWVSQHTVRLSPMSTCHAMTSNMEPTCLV
jgi:tRNA A64-2'-O-ribosylphosphate transferase